MVCITRIASSKSKTDEIKISTEVEKVIMILDIQDWFHDTM